MQKPGETINFIYLDEIKGVDGKLQTRLRQKFVTPGNMKKWLKEQDKIDRKHLEEE